MRTTLYTTAIFLGLAANSFAVECPTPADMKAKIRHFAIMNGAAFSDEFKDQKDIIKANATLMGLTLEQSSKDIPPEDNNGANTQCLYYIGDPKTTIAYVNIKK